MSKIDEYLKRGGRLTSEEEREVYQEGTDDKRHEFAQGWFCGDGDQPIKVVPITQGKDGADQGPPSFVEGYFCQLKSILGKTPAEMEAILGIYGKLPNGAYVMRIRYLLLPGFYSNRAYTHLPGGKRYKPGKDESKNPFRPGRGVGQWELGRPIGAIVLAKLRPGDRLSLHPLDYGRESD